MERVIAINTTRSDYNVKDAASGSITVGELIEILEGWNPKFKVVFRIDNGYTYGYIDENLVVPEDIEEEVEEEDTAWNREDFLSDIRRQIEKNNGEVIPCGCVWLDGDREIVYVGYKGGDLGGFLDDQSFIPLCELSDDDLDSVWFESTQIHGRR